MPVFALAIWVIVRAADPPRHPDTVPRTPAPTAAPSPSSGTGSRATPGPSRSYDPADYAPQVRKHAAGSGITPRLLMVILYNEAYKPHDPDLERAWQRYKPDAAFGIANMHRAAFDETRQGRDFANRRWEELPDDRDLAIEAAAWYLHDLGRQLPAHWPATYSRQELLALGYNAGAGNMLAFARGATPGTQARSYLDRLHANWRSAGRALAP
ncbi:hypothetical protein SSP35_22_00890 [Streptomyces sp. NBRC 110611]|nr:hypothetical protein SSP35_22_00890 [Streptomyces sp. NBRC 110611]